MTWFGRSAGVGWIIVLATGLILAIGRYGTVRVPLVTSALPLFLLLPAILAIVLCLPLLRRTALEAGSTRTLVRQFGWIPAMGAILAATGCLLVMGTTSGPGLAAARNVIGSTGLILLTAGAFGVYWAFSAPLLSLFAANLARPEFRQQAWVEQVLGWPVSTGTQPAGLWTAGALFVVGALVSLRWSGERL